MFKTENNWRVLTASFLFLFVEADTSIRAISISWYWCSTCVCYTCSKTMENFWLRFFNFSDQQIIAEDHLEVNRSLTNTSPPAWLSEKQIDYYNQATIKPPKRIYLELQLVDENSERYLFHKIYTTS